MRIGFRHCLLSSCLFRCSAGWLRWDGKAVCQRGSLCLGGRRGSRTGGRATAPAPAPAPTPGFPHSLPTALPSVAARPVSPPPAAGAVLRQCHRDALGTTTPLLLQQFLSSYSAKAGNRAHCQKSALLAPQEPSQPCLHPCLLLPPSFSLWRLKIHPLKSTSQLRAANTTLSQSGFLSTTTACPCTFQIPE